MHLGSYESGNLYSDKIFGLHDTLEAIRINQNPTNCSDAKFLIAGNWVAGFGSEFHVLGATLGLSMSLGRVMLQFPVAASPLTWQVNNSICSKSGKKNLECYFRSWSKCNILDALGPEAYSILAKYNSSVIPITDSNSALRVLALSKGDMDILKFGNYDQQRDKLQFIKRSTDQYRAVIPHNKGLFKSGFVPLSLYNLVECSPINTQNYYYWWRAISVTYLMRMNGKTRNWIKSQRDGNHRQSCSVGVYIRKGDKYLEMKNISLARYQSAIEQVWTKLYLNRTIAGGNEPARNLFLATEDSATLQDMIVWSKANNWTVDYTNLFNRSGMTAEMTRTQKKAQRGQEKHHELEYLSMLLNLDLLLRCESWVCALRSNFCRLVDELRVTWAKKATHPYADLSVETCAHPPCIGSGITNFDW